MQRRDLLNSNVTGTATCTRPDASAALAQPEAAVFTRHMTSRDDEEADTRHRRRARRQALLLMAASGMVTVILLGGAWLALRNLL